MYSLPINLALNRLGEFIWASHSAADVLDPYELKLNSPDNF
jgi:hypothetical protein